MIDGGLVAIDAACTLVRAMIPGLVTASDDEQLLEGGVMRVALDTAREAVRRGALEVTVASLERAREMPAMKSAQGREELQIARDEGVSFLPGWGPSRLLVGDGQASRRERTHCR